MAHLQKGHFFKKQVCQILSILLWWLPSLDCLLFLQELDMELDADNAALQEAAEEQKLQYALTLLRLEKPSCKTGMSLQSTGKLLECRLRSVLHLSGSRRQKVWPAGLLLLLVLAMYFVFLVPDQSQALSFQKQMRGFHLVQEHLEIQGLSAYWSQQYRIVRPKGIYVQEYDSSNGRWLNQPED